MYAIRSYYVNASPSGQAGKVSIAEVYSHNKAMPFSLFAEQSKETGNKEANFICKQAVLESKGKVTNVDVPDQLWGNKGTLTFEFKLNKDAFSEKQLLVDCPVLTLELKNNSLWPVVKAVPQAKEERKERIQFAFLKPNQWYHLSIAWDGPRKIFRLFLNGEKQQPSYFGQWTKSDFSGDLSLGSLSVAVRNMALFNELLNEYSLALLIKDLDIPKLSGEGRQTFGNGLNLKLYSANLVYEADFAKKQTVIREDDLFENNKRVRHPADADWVLEGRAKAIQAEDCLVVYSSEDGGVAQNHAVITSYSIHYTKLYDCRSGPLFHWAARFHA